MSFSITKKETAALLEHATSLKAARLNVSAALVQANLAVAEAVRMANVEVARYNAAAAAAEAMVRGVAERLRDEVDDKTEKWQESERGEAAIAMTEEWEQGADVLADRADPMSLPALTVEDLFLYGWPGEAIGTLPQEASS